MNKIEKNRFSNCCVRSWRGYTFIEVLITTLIFSIVMLTIYSVFQTGNVSYKKIDSAFDLYQKARIVFNRMDIDLKNSFIYAKNDAKFSGESGKIAFFTVLDFYDNAGKGFQKISQILYESRDSSLWRTQRDGLDALREDTQGMSENLVSQLQELSFQFANHDSGSENHYIWQDTWPKRINQQEAEPKNSLPLAVKVEMILGGVKFIKIIPFAQSYLANND